MGCDQNSVNTVIATLLVVMITALAGCAGSGGRVAGDPSPLLVESSAMPEYRLGTGDVVTVEVRENPDLSVRVAVRADGSIAVPLMDDVRAGRRTPAEIAADIERGLQRFIRSPKVAIVVTELDSTEFRDEVRIVGGVAEPKSISYREGMTVGDLLLEAGGINEFASPDDARLYRAVDGVAHAYPVLLDGILEEGSVGTNYPLEPGDVVSVPERRF